MPLFTHTVLNVVSWNFNRGPIHVDGCIILHNVWKSCCGWSLSPKSKCAFVAQQEISVFKGVQSYFS